ncbi:MAG: DNA translocase FtsK 4TM domain-containing protein [Deltaproteobacteria bacterium]|nr:DNA translocase FtsK 4TM domain-containing protein [Deltaproteobacteria bacterium]
MSRNNATKKGANSRKGKQKASPETLEPASWQRRLGQEMAALLLLGLGVFCFLALITHNTEDAWGLLSVWSAPGVHNGAGKAGAVASGALIWLLGLAAFWTPLIFVGLAWQSHRAGLEELRWLQGLAGAGVLVANSGLLALVRPRLLWDSGWIHTGGRLGDLAAVNLTGLLNRPGASLVLILLLLVGFMGATRLSYAALLSLIGRQLKQAWFLLRQPRQEWEPVPDLPQQGRARQPLIAKPRTLADEPAISPTPPTGEAAAEAAAPARRKAASGGKFSLPPLDLLDPPAPWNQQAQEGQMVAQAEKLEDTLRHFGVEGKVTAIIPGPVVSRFELEPAPGVKISRVTNLADDLALALKALSIRIVAPVPGKAVIGIEVPNPKRQVVALREILSDSAYQKSASRLTIALGKDIMGMPVVTDLARMPHLLIAGATGSGKSVGLNAMILSILYKATPEEVRFLLVDPKRIELSTYEGIPHLLHPVVVSPKEATTALHWTVMEMERRYALLSDMAVRNIDNYNQKVRTLKPGPGESKDDLPRPMPYIVVVIDELADLMLVSSRDTEEYLIRLAQKARASGIHLLVATQRPSVDVITGLIKANFPTRVSFQVSSKADSRVILDFVGAERLLGMGDMLFIPPGTSRLKRIHGAFVTEDEVVRVAEFLKTQAAPEFEPGITEMKEKEQEAEELGDKDEKYQEAVELVAETRNASISMLQRRLRIGYNRAARIIEIMEKEGLVGPSDGVKAREVYVPRR